MEVDSTPRATLQTRIEETGRVIQRDAVGECHLYSFLLVSSGIISTMYLYVGCIKLTSNIAVGLLVVVAFLVTFAVNFGIEGMRQVSPQAKAKVQMSAELSEIKATVTELAKKVDAIQKELQE